jgi:hypothetical protein
VTFQRANYAHAEKVFLGYLPESRRRAPAYESYFDFLRPRSPQEVFQRGLFAYASVHTSWAMNCKLYLALRDFDRWLYHDGVLRQILVDTRAGLHNNRTAFFGRFGRLFWSNPAFFQPDRGERWGCFRNRLMGSMEGLGPAKAAFFAELIYFDETEVVCVDTHMLQLYSVKPSNVGDATLETYDDVERHWRNICLDCGVRPVTARWVAWDIRQKQPDSRFWSRVIEPGEGP